MHLRAHADIGKQALCCWYRDVGNSGQVADTQVCSVKYANDRLVQKNLEFVVSCVMVDG